MGPGVFVEVGNGVSEGMTVGSGRGVELATRVAVGGAVMDGSSAFAVGPSVTPPKAGSAATSEAQAVRVTRKKTDTNKKSRFIQSRGYNYRAEEDH